MPCHTYAVIQDIPANWQAYLEEALPQQPKGLLVRAAGPTEEGVRVIDVWDSQAAWERSSGETPCAARGSANPAWRTRTTLRSLTVEHLFLA